MSLMKEIAEEINAYNAFVVSLVEKIEQFEEEIFLEKRLGLTTEASDYYQVGNKPTDKDTVDFQPQPSVAKPQQIQPPHKAEQPQAQQGNNRIQLMYNPATGRVENAMQSNGFTPQPGYVQANAQQLQDALRHIERIDKGMADKIVAGNVSVWVPKNPQAAPQTEKPVGQAANKIQMDPARLAQAQAAASKMSLA